MVRWILLTVLACCSLSGCTTPGDPLRRRGDEIVVCGQLFHTGAPVVLWTDPGGYDAYRTEKRFVSWEKAAYVPGAGIDTPSRYGVRFAEAGRGPGKTGEALSPETFEQVRGGGWDLPTLRQHVDQFVYHYDVCGTSRQCFRVLHDVRGLSVHFMLDIDGTIYQTLDVKERAWHATTSNDRSVGIEIANMGAYPFKEGEALPKVLTNWYETTERDGVETTRLRIPESYGDGGVRGEITGPARAAPVVGEIQGRAMAMYDLTPEQYDSLAKLTAALCRVLPAIRCDYPRDADGNLVTGKLADEELAAYQGLLGHYHIQENKADPGPAFQWDRVVGEARRMLGE
jgi:N-acetylmuramoyl-L-alanine amidase